MPATPAQDNEFIPTRASLLSRLKNWDDQESWKDFFETYWKMLYSVARRSGLSDAEAQDMVQETIAAVAKKMPDFRYDPALGSFKGWLNLIIRRRIIDHYRRVQRQPQQQYQPTQEMDSAVGTGMMERIPDPAGDQVERIYEEEWQKHIFEAALERVKRKVDLKQFQMFDCYGLKNWPANEVAKNLGVSVESVYTAKHRVAQLVKEEVQRLEQKMM